MAKKIERLTKEQIAQVEALACVLTRAQVAEYFGVTLPTWLELEERQPDILLAYKRGKARIVGEIGSKLIEKARGGNLSAMMFFLKTRAGWRETREQDDIEQILGISEKAPDTTLELVVVRANAAADN